MVAVTDDVSVNVRRLMAKDLFTLARILNNARPDVERIVRDGQPPAAPLHVLGDEPAEAPSSSGFTFDMQEMGMTIIFSLLGQANSEIRPWLADMAGLKEREFDGLPLTDTLGVIEGVVQQEDWSAFLERLSSMFKRSVRIST